MFSRFRFVVPLKKIDTASVLMGLKTTMLQIGLDKPGVFLLDGGHDFKDQLRQTIQAWDSKARVYAPHHHESAGAIEIFNRAIKKKFGLLLDGSGKKWIHLYLDALGLYNATPHTALSDGSTAAITPAEVFLGRSLKFEWDLPENSGNVDKLKPSKMAVELKKQAENVKKIVNAARDEYYKAMEGAEKNASHRFRTFERGDEITKNKPTGSKREDKVSPLQEGPYLVVEVGESCADYMVQRIGSSDAPKWVHVDFIKRLKRATHEDDAEAIVPTKPHSKKYKLKLLEGEKGKTRKTKQCRVLWDDESVTWEPLANLAQVATAVKEWTKLMEADRHKLTAMSAEELEAMHAVAVPELAAEGSEAAIHSVAAIITRLPDMLESRRERKPTLKLQKRKTEEMTKKVAPVNLLAQC